MKRLRSYILMATGFAVLVMAVGVFSAGPAIAQAVRAALVSNVDDPGRIPYEDRGACNFDNNASINCPVLRSVSAGKRVVITHISGFVTDNLPVGTLIFAGLDTSRDRVLLLAAFQGSAEGRNYFMISQPVLAVYDAGRTPDMFVSLSAAPGAGSGMVFHVSGYILDCNTSPCAAIAP